MIDHFPVNLLDTATNLIATIIAPDIAAILNSMPNRLILPVLDLHLQKGDCGKAPITWMYADCQRLAKAR